ncbi:MAG: heavy-metal-associated domain-containing protein [Ectothiorhodospiraceae bacterium]|nr:heavy-metal-associated domain-containing protein [Ectothiorhodospiraceae bacterium]
MLELLVNDMTCGHCEASIRDAVARLDPSAGVRVDLERKRLWIESTVPGERIVEAIQAIGFTPEPVATA